MLTLCKACNEVNTKKSNGDVDYCAECNSVEQGFLYLTEFELNDNLLVDENDNLYDDDFDFIDTVDSWLENTASVEEKRKYNKLMGV